MSRDRDCGKAGPVSWAQLGTPGLHGPSGLKLVAAPPGLWAGEELVLLVPLLPQ